MTACSSQPIGSLRNLLTDLTQSCCICEPQEPSSCASPARRVAMEPRGTAAEPSNKRPRSSPDYPQIASKAPKTQSNHHLQINYLARQYTDNLPLVSVEDNMPAIMHLIGEYDGVLHRHESIAGNLGACPLGPILIKRFERLFDGPPRVLKSNGKDAPNITWLDVVEFARNKPEQFNLERSRNGVRVCQFYTKQCRVEISEEDYVVIASGMPQKMIPPQPIIEDEEKELGALEILEKNLQQIIQAADQGKCCPTCLLGGPTNRTSVSARARQLNHRLKNRRTAIVTRRENDATLHSQPRRSLSPTWRDPNGQVHALLNGNGSSSAHSSAHSPSTGFVAVNAHRNGAVEPMQEDNALPSPFTFPHSSTDNITIINGTSIKGASPTTRAELMKKFFTTADRQARGLEEPTGQLNRQAPRPKPRASDAGEYSMYTPAPTTVPIPSTPSSLLPPPRSTQQEKDDSGPFKMLMVARMEELERGERVIPPCDRCRRLHMDCLKNLTACMGCTKKHAKCSWKDVKEEELQEIEAQGIGQRRAAEDHHPTDQSAPAQAPASGPSIAPAPAPVSAPAAQEPERLYQESMPERPHQEFTPGHGWSYGGRRESAPVPGHYTVTEASPRRAKSEHHGSAVSNHGRRVSFNRSAETGADDDDPGANQRLMQAILDTVDHHSRAAAASTETASKGEPHEVSSDREREQEMVRA